MLVAAPSIKIFKVFGVKMCITNHIREQSGMLSPLTKTGIFEYDQ